MAQMSENSNSNMSERSEPPAEAADSSKENSKEERKKLKILALHGYRQNGALFRAKIGSFRKAVSKYAQLTFISAPHRVVNEEGGGDEAPLEKKLSTGLVITNDAPPPNENDWWDTECEEAAEKRRAAKKEYCSKKTKENLDTYRKLAAKSKRTVLRKKGADARSWWFNAEDNTFSGRCLGGPAIGFEDTLRLIERTVAEHGPFDGLMGFSQGACLAGILAAMQQKGYLPYTFKFVIFTSGFRSGSLVHKGFYDEEIDLPSLHVYGESDSIIPKEMSESLISLYVKPVVVEHSGGHYVACSGSIRDSYQDFLHDRCQDLKEDDEEVKEDSDRRNS